MGNPILFGESAHIVQFFLVSRSERIVHERLIMNDLLVVHERFVCSSILDRSNFDSSFIFPTLCKIRFLDVYNIYLELS